MTGKVLAFSNQQRSEQQEDNRTKNYSIEWSLRPLVTCLRIIGIPVGDLQQQPNDKGRSDLIIFLTWFWALALFCAHLSLVLFCCWSLSDSMRRSPAETWNNLINFFNFSLATTTVHFGWLTIATPQWNNGLLNTIHRMEHQESFCPTFLERIRRVSILGVYLIIMAFLSLAGTIIPCFITYGVGLAVLNGLRVVFVSYIFAGLAVFCCLCRMVSLMLQSLNKQIESSLVLGEICSSTQLDGWRDRYHIISDLVVSVNRSFGFILLVSIAFQFIWMVNSSFYTLIGFRDPHYGTPADTFINLSFEVFAFVCFVALVYISHSVKDQGLNCAVLLRRLCRPSSPTLRAQMDNFAVEVSLSVPVMSACGFFNIDLGLIPNIIGTTLTYLLILCQFQTTE